MRRTPLKRTAIRLHARAALRRRTPLRSTVTDPKPARARSVPDDLRRVLRDRSGGRCEIGLPGLCSVWATEVSHRQARKMGGRHGAARPGNDRLANTMLSCGSCHRWSHEHPSEARTLGLQVPEGRDPALEPVLRRGQPVYLSDVGGVYPYEAVGA